MDRQHESQRAQAAGSHSLPIADAMPEPTILQFAPLFICLSQLVKP
jgi:hypothetical protein